MSTALYSGASGMENNQLKVDVTANDLANLESTAYKKTTANFADLVYQTLRTVGSDTGGGEAAPTGIEIGTGSQLVSTNKVFTTGSFSSTNNDMDIAIEGDGFLEVTRPDGTMAYTRAGDLKVNSQGQVVTSTGYPVQSGFAQIPSGAKVAIAQNGQVTLSLPGGGTSTFRIALTRFPNPSGLMSIGSNLYKESPASGTPETGNPQENGFGGIIQGHLEKSNVSAVEAMVQLIIAQRNYEMNSKSITTADEMLGAINGLKR